MADFRLDGDGGDPSVLIEEESQDQLQVVKKNLSSLARRDGSVVSMTPQALSLMQKMLTPGGDSEDDKFINAWRSCTFIDEEEALDHVAAYQEAKDLGMDTGFNIRYMYALCSANRKGNFNNNLVAVLTDTLQSGKWANAEKGKKRDAGSYNPRSPLSD